MRDRSQQTTSTARFELKTGGPDVLLPFIEFYFIAFFFLFCQFISAFFSSYSHFTSFGFLYLLPAAILFFFLFLLILSHIYTNFLRLRYVLRLVLELSPFINFVLFVSSFSLTYSFIPKLTSFFFFLFLKYSNFLFSISSLSISTLSITFFLLFS